MSRLLAGLGAACVWAFLLAPADAGAQIAAASPDIAQKIAAFGRVINPPDVAALYTPLQEKEPYAGIKVTRDIKYGAADRNLLDVFAADGAGGARPVLIFVHGGGFVAGNKRAPGTPFNDQVPLWAARNGFVGVNMTYRLAPQNPWPAGAEDLGAAVRWVRANAAAHGGDPARVFLMGHSAGAVHVASYVAHSTFHGPDGIGLAGAIMVSGLFDLTARPPGPPEKAYFGEDTTKYAERSSLPGLLKARIPLLVVYAELDPPAFEQESEKLNAALCKAGHCPQLVKLPGHSHISEVYSINTKDVGLTNQILAFTKSAR
ncbi:MAG TPA: alpha/beta hydrolase [Vineibacter sp.]|nr:alpha/beta hydrolase [Vineibacter sp.]